MELPQTFSRLWNISWKISKIWYLWTLLYQFSNKSDSVHILSPNSFLRFFAFTICCTNPFTYFSHTTIIFLQKVKSTFVQKLNVYFSYHLCYSVPFSNVCFIIWFFWCGNIILFDGIEINDYLLLRYFSNYFPTFFQNIDFQNSFLLASNL